jgi:hypothetical protein
MTGGLHHSGRARIAHSFPFVVAAALSSGRSVSMRLGAEGEDGITGTTPRLAALLRHHRLAAGFTQEGLAEAARMSARGVQDLERGVSIRPRVEKTTYVWDPAATTYDFTQVDFYSWYTTKVRAYNAAGPGQGCFSAYVSMDP